jgi:hypothetical protein
LTSLSRTHRVGGANWPSEIAATQLVVQRQIERPQLIVNNLVVFVLTGIALLLPKTG